MVKYKIQYFPTASSQLKKKKKKKETKTQDVYLVETRIC